MAVEISRLRSEISEMRRISPVGEILNHQSGGEAELRMDSSGITDDSTYRSEFTADRCGIPKHQFGGYINCDGGPQSSNIQVLQYRAD